MDGLRSGRRESKVGFDATARASRPSFDGLQASCTRLGKIGSCSPTRTPRGVDGTSLRRSGILSQLTFV